MKIDKQKRNLIHFYKQVALLIIKSEKRYVTLRELEDRFPKWKDAIFSWMQWTDAKEWFGRGGGFRPGEGTTYTLKHPYSEMTPGEMISAMNKHYGLYQD